MMEERYHATTQNRFYPDMSNVNQNFTVEAKLTTPPTYIYIYIYVYVYVYIYIYIYIYILLILEKPTFWAHVVLMRFVCFLTLTALPDNLQWSNIVFSVT